MKKLFPVKMTKQNLAFLLTAPDFIGDKNIRMMTKAKIISRLSALGFWGYKKEILKIDKGYIQEKYETDNNKGRQR